MRKNSGFLTTTVLLLSLPILGLADSSARKGTLVDLPKHRIIVFVWDGLRPDSVTASNTSNLYRLAKRGVWFAHNHSSYPTFTMMNASSFATGNFAGKNGFYGNTLWEAQAHGGDSQGKPVDFQQPVFTEDYKILQDLNNAEPLIQVVTLFQQAQQLGIQTAAIGKSGAAFMQDYKQGGVVFDEKHVSPLSFVNYLQQNKYPLPADTIYAYKNIKLSKQNGNPTGYGKIATLSDGVTTNPAVGVISPYNKDNTYLMNSYLQEVVPHYHPQLSIVWLRNPDTTEHNYGVGSKAYYNALKNQDNLLGKLLQSLKQRHVMKNTDVIVVSDHGHSNVSGPLTVFPLRTITQNHVGNISSNGYSVSGDFRPADLLHQAGFHAYDGVGCEYDPVLTGITKDGHHIVPVKVDTTGKVCGGDVKVVDQNGHRVNSLGKKYNTPAYLVPKVLPKDAVIVAANGGSTYFYVPSHNQALCKKLVRFFQSHRQFGPIFVDQRYGNLPGTMPLSLIKLHNKDHRNPDIIVSSNYDKNAVIRGYKGIEYNSDGSDRGMHGSFSPVDVHNTLIANGPDFNQHQIDNLPSGNVDVAPTIAYLLHFKLANRDGRVLLEALKKGASANQYIAIHSVYSPHKPAVIDNNRHYTMSLHTTTLLRHNHFYTYFDYAKSKRY